jgi:hypothetical protein
VLLSVGDGYGTAFVRGTTKCGRVHGAMTMSQYSLFLFPYGGITTCAFGCCGKGYHLCQAVLSSGRKQALLAVFMTE